MAATRPIYLDNHATTPVDPRVLEVMLPYFSEKFGNAASRSHAFGWEAEAAVERAREQVAALVGGRPTEIVFTSGATEANNLALKGVAGAYRSRGRHLVTIATEHKAVLDPCARLAGEGAEVTVLRPAPDGLVSPAAVAAAAGEGTVLVSVMHANNEIGVLQPLAEIVAAVKEKGSHILFHSDAAQSAGKVPLSVEELGLDLVSLSAHKLYGPKGVGALWVRRRPRRRVDPLLDGGGHERGMRSGTLPVPLVVGFGAACELAAAEMEAEAARTLALRERLREGVTTRLEGVTVNGTLAARLPGNLHLSFAGVDGDALLLALREVALSSGSACTSASLAPSHVLRALGVDDDLADGSIRFGVGRFNTAEEIERVIELVVSAVERLRELPGASATR